MDAGHPFGNIGLRNIANTAALWNCVALLQVVGLGRSRLCLHTAVARWDAVADESRPLRLYSDACIDGFGASLEQEQLDGSVRPIVYISRAILPAERNWTVFDLEAGSIVWAIKRLRGYLWSTRFEIYTDHQAFTSIVKVGEHNTRVQRWLEYLSNFLHAGLPQKGSANGNADFLSRLPLPAAAADTSGPDSIAGMDVQGSS